MTRNLTNYHSHCSLCDGRAPMEDFVREAVRRGFTSYGISSHAPLPFPAVWTLDRGDGTTAVYAIPADTLTGLSRYGNDPKNSLLCIPMYTKNADSAAALIGLMLEKLAAAGK